MKDLLQLQLCERPLNNVTFNHSKSTLKEEIKCSFLYPKSAPPNLVSSLFGIIIPFLMIAFHKVKSEPEPEAPYPRYLDLKACIRKRKKTLSRIQPLIDELTQLGGKNSQRWNQAVYEDYISDLNEHLDDRTFFVLENDIQYFVQAVKEEHRIKNTYRLFHQKNSTNKVNQNSPRQTFEI
jgi:hypothetical protein